MQNLGTRGLKVFEERLLKVANDMERSSTTGKRNILKSTGLYTFAVRSHIGKNT